MEKSALVRIKTKFLHAAVCIASASLITSTHAAVLASTDFNDSTIGGTSNVKTSLNWTLNGLDDPGDMAALDSGGGNQTLFDTSALAKDIFIPGVNTGNGNTFWTTDISITVATGFSVTIESVTLNAVSVSGGQAENVDRRNDYTAFLFNPSMGLIDEVTVADTVAGTGAGQPLVTLDLADTALTLPGTYTLRIKGGDFAGSDETGNHTGFDNLAINGTAVIPEPSTSSLIGLAAIGIAISRRRK